jgi:hypothetical protein
LHSQRNTLAVCHHHKLRTLSTFGFTDACAFFLPTKTCRRQRFLPSSGVVSRPIRREKFARHSARFPAPPNRVACASKCSPRESAFSAKGHSRQETRRGAAGGQARPVGKRPATLRNQVAITP